MSKQTVQFVVGEKAGPFVSGEELGKIVSAHFGLDDAPVAEVSIVMLPQELARVVVTMILDRNLLAKLRVEATQEK